MGTTIYTTSDTAFQNISAKITECMVELNQEQNSIQNKINLKLNEFIQVFCKKLNAYKSDEQYGKKNQEQNEQQEKKQEDKIKRNLIAFDEKMIRDAARFILERTGYVLGKDAIKNVSIPEENQAFIKNIVMNAQNKPEYELYNPKWLNKK